MDIPDANPIEHVWNQLRTRVQRRSNSMITTEQLPEGLTEAEDNVFQDVL